MDGVLAADLSFFFQSPSKASKTVTLTKLWTLEKKLGKVVKLGSLI